MNDMRISWIAIVLFVIGVNVAKAQSDNELIQHLNLVEIEGGTFAMGCAGIDGMECPGKERPVHSVTLSSFYMMKTEVTQALWREVMGNNPSKFVGCDDCPVESVSWNEIEAFILSLNKLTGKTFRLPTEAEWEYACRGGNQSKGYYFGGDNKVTNVAWSAETSGEKSQPVAKLAPNELGLFDMSGNVWEWCNDWYFGYKAGAQIDPKGSDTGLYKVVRGGSWSSNFYDCRISFRSAETPETSSESIGFRLVMVKE
jgi:formylglycine-generating enzyme